MLAFQGAQGKVDANKAANVALLAEQADIARDIAKTKGSRDPGFWMTLNDTQVTDKELDKAIGPWQQNSVTGAIMPRGKRMPAEPAKVTSDLLIKLNDKNLAQYSAAEKALVSIGKLDITLETINNVDADQLGITAEIKNGVNRLRARFLDDPNAVKELNSYQLLDAVLGQDVFGAIQSLGIGARGLDTPNEREFLRKVLTGTTTLDKNTLIQMAAMRRKQEEQIVDNYNDRLNAGQLKSFLTQAEGQLQTTPFQYSPINLGDVMAADDWLDTEEGQEWARNQ